MYFEIWNTANKNDLLLISKLFLFDKSVNNTIQIKIERYKVQYTVFEFCAQEKKSEGKYEKQSSFTKLWSEYLVDSERSLWICSESELYLTDRDFDGFLFFETWISNLENRPN